MQRFMMNDHNTVEIIVFGKGYGESILVGINNEKYVVIDSFIETSSNLPMALKYFQDKMINPETIAGIICTHWDNDHVKGISEIISRHNSVLTIYLPIVFTDKKFLEYLNLLSNDEYKSASEFSKVMNFYKKGKCKLKFILADKILLGKEIADQRFQIKALSPNDKQYEEFLSSIVIPQAGDKKKRLLSNENTLSAVTYIETLFGSILLGGDLENSPRGGWKDICDNYYEKYRSHIFKVPHHGSKNGYYADTWNLLLENPISIITRFNNSHLPTNEMIDKIKQTSSDVYIIGEEPKRDKSTLKDIKKYDKNSLISSVIILDSKYGYVRLTKNDIQEDWQIETFGAVKKVQ